MHRVLITPQWTIGKNAGGELSQRLLELLGEVQQHGSLLAACKRSGGSYRHAWSLIKQGEEQLGIQLLKKERGRGSTLTAFAQKLVWAGLRINARLAPLLESLASELEVEIASVLSEKSEVLKIHASHGFAVERLIEALGQMGMAVERKYVASQEAVEDLTIGTCDLAGFHIPQGAFEHVVFKHYAKWLDNKEHRLIHVATRRQGLMVARGNPLKIYALEDLTKPGVRFVNRQPSSGTRFLLESMLRSKAIPKERINGFELGEFTHAAVAAYVASGMADAGMGVETPCRRFNLEFVPLATERYFLLCKAKDLNRSVLQSVLKILSSQEFLNGVNELPGYSAQQCGQLSTLDEAFKGLKAVAN